MNRPAHFYSGAATELPRRLVPRLLRAHGQQNISLTHSLSLSAQLVAPHAASNSTPCVASCNSAYPQIVETIPVGMTNSLNFTSIANGWLDMINGAKYNISVDAFYVTLSQGAANWPADAGGSIGLSVLTALIKAQARGVYVRVVVGWPIMDPEGATDPQTLENAGIDVRRLNWANATGLGGVLHSKFMIADDEIAYVGSANFDWRSLSQVKELGIIIRDCNALVQDMLLIFEQHWYLGAPNYVPKEWDMKYWPIYNNNTPLMMTVEDTKVAGWLAVSPPSLCPPTRTKDADAILDMIRSANTYLRMSVMEYSPFFLYVKPTTIWPLLDNEIRLAALRGVKVSFILASWAHTAMDTVPYLQSLAVLPNVEVRLFIVPKWQTPNGTEIPYTRVDHSKYIISESRYYITTSNWTPDYVS